MGARFRLDAGFSTAGYGAKARAVIKAMKTYGLVLADNGSRVVLPGRAEHALAAHGWSRSSRRIPASAFVAVDTSSLMVDPDSAQVK